MIKDVEIAITRDTTAASSAGFGMPLIVGVEGVQDYVEVSTLAEVVAAGHITTSKAYKMAAAMFAQTPRVGKIAMVGFADATDLESDLDSLVQTENDWYFLLCTAKGIPQVKELSVWAAGAGKLYFAAPTVSDVDAMEALAEDADLKYDSTVLAYHDDPETGWIEAAWVSKCASRHPGSITWKFKTLNGVAPVALTTDEIGTLHDVNVNTYINKMGMPQTSEGKTVSGEFIDVIRGTDWISQRITERVQTLLSGSNKVPYDNRGIALVVAEIQAVMQEGVSQEVIARDSDGNGIWTVTAPDRADIAKSDIADRLLPDVKFALTLAGAIHSVRISGVVQI